MLDDAASVLDEAVSVLLFPVDVTFFTALLVLTMMPVEPTKQDRK